MSAVAHRTSPHTHTASMPHPPMDSSSKRISVKSEGELSTCPLSPPGLPLKMDACWICRHAGPFVRHTPNTMSITLDIDIIAHNLISNHPY